jgi:histidyl-tRNA synthetase
MSLGPLPGFRDFYPEALAERSFIFDAWRKVAREYGFLEYDGPPLESLELYTKKSGEEIVAQLYNFTDKGGREVALRPEMTPTLARLVAAKANALRKPVRWFSTPQLFRYERQQRGRLREHFQLNLDIIGEPDVTADAELLAAAIDVMRAVGLSASDVRARVSDRRLLQGLLGTAGVDEARIPTVFGIVDKLEREPRPVLERRLAEAGFDVATISRVFDVLKSGDFGALRDEFGTVPAVRESFARLDRYFEYLDALGVVDWVRFDLSIVRGLAYYTGIVFELFDAAGELRAICGGGRYDNLLKSLGGVDLPALGFGMGDVVLGELLRARGLMPRFEPSLDYWVAAEREDQLPQVMRVTSALRGAGASVEYALRKQSLDKQRKAAKAAGAARIILVSDNFESSGQVRVQFSDPAEAQAAGGGPFGRPVTLESVLEELRERAAAGGRSNVALTTDT